eukprot:365195-Chlamydomonas_euryale.AAC.21
MTCTVSYDVNGMRTGCGDARCKVRTSYSMTQTEASVGGAGEPANLEKGCIACACMSTPGHYASAAARAGRLPERAALRLPQCHPGVGALKRGRLHTQDRADSEPSLSPPFRVAQPGCMQPPLHRSPGTLLCFAARPPPVSGARAASRRLGLQPSLHVLRNAVHLAGQPVEKRRQRLAIGQPRHGVPQLVEQRVRHRLEPRQSLARVVLQQLRNQVDRLRRQLPAEDL